METLFAQSEGFGRSMDPIFTAPDDARPGALPASAFGIQDNADATAPVVLAIDHFDFG